MISIPLMVICALVASFPVTTLSVGSGIYTIVLLSFVNSLIAHVFAIFWILKSLVLPRCIFAISGISTINPLFSIVSVDSLVFILWICPCGSMIYSICFILLGSTSCVVVASNLFDWSVIVFITLLFSEKYHRWFPRSVQKRLRYMTLSLSLGRTLSWIMNLSYHGVWSLSILSFI